MNSNENKNGVVGIAYHGCLVGENFETWSDKGIGFWLSEEEYWAKGYAERIANRKNGSPNVIKCEYKLCNAFEIGDLEEAATDAVLDEISVGTGVPIEFLKKLRIEAGYSGKELDEPCLFEITNTAPFILRMKELGYDGMLGYENASLQRVVCVFSKELLRSLE